VVSFPWAKWRKASTTDVADIQKTWKENGV
jgi:hypothetical protein